MGGRPVSGAPRVLVEVCVDDLAGAVAAERGGADRIELCADLLEGGTTPSSGLIDAVLSRVQRVGVQVMVRPRGGGFVLDEDDLAVMLADVRSVRRRAERSTVPVGLVLGALTEDGRVDEDALTRLAAAAGDLPITFHKAFDEAADLAAAYGVLKAHGVARVLTAGGAPTAREGAVALAGLVEGSRGGPVVMAGGSVRAGGAAALIAATGVTEVHLRAQVASGRGDGTLQTDEALVRAVVDAVARSASGEAPDARGVIAIDVGGTTLKGAVVDVAGVVRLTRTVDAASAVAPQETLARVRELALRLRRDARREGVEPVAAGVVSPGIVDEQAGVVRFASSLGWRDVPLGALLADDLRLPVVIGHDVRAAGLAEHSFGRAAGRRDAVLVAIGTGVAASLRIGDRPVAGAVGAAGEVGHMPVVPNGEPCPCGQLGCVEVYLSGGGLARRYRARRPDAPRTAAEIVAHLDDDPVARAVWDEGVDALARGLVATTLLVDPEVVVLAGGVAQAGALLVDPVRARMTELLAWRSPPELTVSSLGPEAARAGAAVLAFEAAGAPDVPRSWLGAPRPADPLPRLA